MTMRERTVAAALVAALGLGGPALAQQARDINPTPMPPGSRAGDAPGMGGTGAGTPGQGVQVRPGGPADRGMPGGMGAQAPSAQPDVDRGTAPGTPRGGAATGTTTPGTGAQGAGTGALVPGANSFTEGQARARISDAGFNDVQELRLDDQGIWRGRAMRGGQQTGVALDYRGNVVAIPR